MTTVSQLITFLQQLNPELKVKVAQYSSDRFGWSLDWTDMELPRLGNGELETTTVDAMHEDHLYIGNIR